MVKLTALQSVRLFGWRNPRPILVWEDVLRLGLSLDALICVGMHTSELVLLQPDPAEWARHAKAGLCHARMMFTWPANPFVHLGADLGDVISQKFTSEELMHMEVNYAQLVKYGMTARTERMFKFDTVEWAVMGKP